MMLALKQEVSGRDMGLLWRGTLRGGEEDHCAWSIGARLQYLALDRIWIVGPEPLVSKKSKNSGQGKPAVQATVINSSSRSKSGMSRIH
jgi:hypothetical protein